MESLVSLTVSYYTGLPHGFQELKPSSSIPRSSQPLLMLQLGRRFCCIQCRPKTEPNSILFQAACLNSVRDPTEPENEPPQTVTLLQQPRHSLSRTSVLRPSPQRSFALLSESPSFDCRYQPTALYVGPKAASTNCSTNANF
jgi:hypothetical protein